MGQHLGGALGTSRGGRRGPAGLEPGLVGVGHLRGRRGGRVPSLASLLEVALVPGSLGEHLHPALLVLLQASPELCALPLALHLPGEAGSGFTLRRALSANQPISQEIWRHARLGNVGASLMNKINGRTSFGTKIAAHVMSSYLFTEISPPKTK